MILNDHIFWASSILLSSCTLLIHKKVIPDLLPNSAILESFWSLNQTVDLSGCPLSGSVYALSPDTVTIDGLLGS